MTDAAGRAAALIQLKRGPEAIELLAKALASEPESSRLLCLLAVAHLQDRRFGSALDAAQQAIAASPESGLAHAVASAALFGLGRFKESEEAARSAVALDPFSWYAHARLALALTRFIRPKECMAAARRAVELAPHEAEAHYILGVCAQRLGQRSEARGAFEATLALDPDHAAAFNDHGLWLMRRWRFLAAARWFAAAIGSRPDAQVAAHNLNALASALLYYIFLGASGLLLLTAGLEAADPAARSWTAAVALVGIVAGAIYAIRELPRAVRAYYLRLPLHSVWFGSRYALATGMLGLFAVSAMPTMSKQSESMIFDIAVALWVVQIGVVLAHGINLSKRVGAISDPRD